MRETNEFVLIKEFRDSEHIQIPKNVDACRVGMKKTKRTKNSNRKSSFRIFSQNENVNSKTPVLPPMEVKAPPNTNCLVVDLLQLADSYSQGFKHEQVERRLGNSGGENFNQLPNWNKNNQHQFEFSTSSFPESYFKQKKEKKLSKSPEKAPLNCSEQIDNCFSKSWPLVHRPCEGAHSRFPKLAVARKSVPSESSSFSRDLLKFNRSRPFRMSKLSALEENTDSSPKFDPAQANFKVEKMHHTSKLPEENRMLPGTKADRKACAIQIGSEELRNYKIYPNNNNNQAQSDTTGTSGSELTSVTKEIVTEQEADKQISFERTEAASIDVTKKCMQWLEGVAKERLENPDEFFLPHLLLP